MHNKFQVGEIVHHKKYNYRGVIISFDEECKATDDWYYANKTQPERAQRWYFVLVDKTEITTYVAEENLESDNKKDPIVHPLVNKFFISFFQGRYHQFSMN